MNNQASVLNAAPSRVKIALLLLGVIAAAASAGAANAATVEDDVLRVVVRYSPESLATDAGARAVYHRLVAAAEQVCPAGGGRYIVSSAVERCRQESLARAVRQIGSPKLAALYAASSRSG